MTEVCGRIVALRLSAVLLAGVLLPPGLATALEELRGEEAAIKACDQRLCTIVMQRNPKGEDLRCSVTKTWARSTIKEADSQKLSWGYGDARCTAEISLSRVRLIAVLNGEGKKFFVPPHTVNCVVEQDGKLEKVTATVAPKIVFKDGKADKVWVNLKEVDGPPGIKGTLVAAAEFADRLGLFHRQMIKAINRYIDRHCPKTYPQLITAASPAGQKSGDKKKAP